MRHFHRTHLLPADVMKAADDFFPGLGLSQTATASRMRTFTGPLGTMTVTARPEGGHYTFVEVDTDQMGESRMDKNVKKFFNRLHRQADPRHRLAVSY